MLYTRASKNIPSGSITLERPKLFLDSVSVLKRHSKTSWPRADRSLSPTSRRL